jgi:hypothetical protein
MSDDCTHNTAVMKQFMDAVKAEKGAKKWAT